MAKELNKYLANEKEYSKELIDVVKSFSFAKKEIGEIGQMKQSSGWKILDKKIREELHTRIEELVKPDLKVMTLLALLKVADTKSLNKILDEEIERSLPE